MRDLSPKQQQIVGYVADNGPVSAADVATSLMLSRPPYSVLDTLCRHGLLAATYTGHHRGRGRAYVITDAGQEAYDTLFADKPDDDLSDDPIPVRITLALASGTYTRRYVHDTITWIPASYRLTWDQLHPTEQAAVLAARAAPDGEATVGHVTAKVPRA